MELHSTLANISIKQFIILKTKRNWSILFEKKDMMIAYVLSYSTRDKRTVYTMHIAQLSLVLLRSKMQNFFSEFYLCNEKC